MTDRRQYLRSGLTGLLDADPGRRAGARESTLAPDCDWAVSHPVGTLRGVSAVTDGFVAPLREALHHVQRRDEIFIGGDNRRETGGYWIAALCHYVGTFAAPLWGIAPSGHLAFLRAGEFYRLDAEGRVTTARLILDLPDLMRQAGRPPFPFSYGLETLFPGPATHDGVCPEPTGGPDALDLVERMLADLHAFDVVTYGSSGQTGSTGAWAEDMLWYGPGGIGSSYRWEGFVADHRAAFLTAFPDRRGGNHYCRIGDGAYAAVSGWPSMTMTFQGDYLGVVADGRPLTLRVMDFYRTASGRIAENWVLLDYMDLMQQMGVDLIARDRDAAET